MNKDNKFNQSVYANAYNKSHYTERKVRLKPEEWAKINSFCSKNNITLNGLFVRAALYIIDQNVDISAKTDD